MAESSRRFVLEGMMSPDRSAQSEREAILKASRGNALYALFADYPTYYEDSDWTEDPLADVSRTEETLRWVNASKFSSLDHGSRSSSGGPDGWTDSPGAPSGRPSRSSTPRITELTDLSLAQAGDARGAASHTRVSGQLQPTRECTEDQQEPILTTVMIRNLSAGTTTADFMQYLHEAGLGFAYDYLFIPQSKPKEHSQRTCKGYAFVNFYQGLTASELQAALYQSNIPKKHRMVICPALHQGVLKNLEQMFSLNKENRDVVNVFTSVWLRVDGVMQPMDVPLAYETYRTGGQGITHY
jgi:hypothetical protein